MKYINSIHKKKEDKPPFLFNKQTLFGHLSTVLLFFLLLSIGQLTPECHTKRCSSQGVKVANI